MNKKAAFHQFINHSEKLFRRFSNFTKHQKAFVLFLFSFAIVALLFPIASVSNIGEDVGGYSVWLLGSTYFKSFVVIVLALAFLFGRNMHMTFKSFVVKSFGFRETEPVLNFIFLWIIASAYMGILDTLGLVRQQTGTISVSWGLWMQLLVLIIGMGISIVEVWKSASHNSQKTKILNILDDEAPKAKEGKRVLQHLFEDEELE